MELDFKSDVSLAKAEEHAGSIPAALTILVNAEQEADRLNALNEVNKEEKMPKTKGKYILKTGNYTCPECGRKDTKLLSHAIHMARVHKMKPVKSSAVDEANDILKETGRVLKSTSTKVIMSAKR